MSKKKYISLVVILVAVSAITGFLVWLLPGIGSVSMPLAAPPKPNAYKFYLKAAGSVVDGGDVAYAAANQANNLGHIYTLNEKEGLICKNAQVLATFRKGLIYRCQVPTSRYRNCDVFPDMARLGGLSNLIRLDGRVKAVHSDWPGAMISYIDDIQLGADVSKGGTIAVLSRGITLQAIGRMNAWEVLNHLDAKQAKAALARMEKIDRTQAKLYDALCYEKWLNRSLLLDPKISGMTRWQSVKSFVPDIPVYLHSRQEIAYINACFDDVEKIYALRTSIRVPRGVHTGFASLPWMYERLRLAVPENEAQNRLLMVSLALRAYRIEHGHYPPDLMPIATNYLTEMPLDPFSGRPLAYRPAGNSYVLYSVGPDGIDDSGKPVEDVKAKTARARYYIEGKSKGDLVAGVNTCCSLWAK